MNLVDRLRSRFGEFWWWSLMLFLALRSGDVINAVIGVWIVPHFVVQGELGAVLPLSGIAAFLGTPIAILVVVFQRYLSRYHALGDEGKKKSLLYGFIGFLVPAVVAIFAGAYLIMPMFFERIRVGRGSLGLLIVVGAAVGTIHPVFMNALQALRKFRTLTLVNLVCAPVRLVTMVLAMPFYALSGYMLGQCAGPIVQILLSTVSLRRATIGAKCERGFWRTEGPGIARYAVKMALYMGFSGLSAAVFALIIRQRLPEVESAGYYMISRFSEMAIYAGATLSAMMFPFAVAAVTKGEDADALLRKTQVGTLVAGVVCVAALAVLGGPMLRLTAMWRDYAVYAPDMTLLAVSLVCGMLATNRLQFECAADRFGFLWYVVPTYALQTAFLFAFTGYGYFSGVLPQSAVEWMASLKIGTLRNMLIVGLVTNVALLAFSQIQVIRRRRT